MLSELSGTDDDCLLFVCLCVCNATNLSYNSRCSVSQGRRPAGLSSNFLRNHSHPKVKNNVRDAYFRNETQSLGGLRTATDFKVYIN